MGQTQHCSLVGKQTRFPAFASASKRVPLLLGKWPPSCCIREGGASGQDRADASTLLPSWGPGAHWALSPSLEGLRNMLFPACKKKKKCTLKRTFLNLNFKWHVQYGRRGFPKISETSAVKFWHGTPCEEAGLVSSQAARATCPFAGWGIGVSQVCKYTRICLQRAPPPPVDSFLCTHTVCLIPSFPCSPPRSAGEAWQHFAFPRDG